MSITVFQPCRLLRIVSAALLLWSLATGLASAQLDIRFPANDDLLIVGQSTPLSVVTPTLQTFSSYAEATLEVRLRPLADADAEARDAFERSGMTVEFSSEFTSDVGISVRDQNDMTHIVFGDRDDGEIRLGSRSGDVVGVVSPTPDEDSTFSLTVSFSREPQTGDPDIAVPTFMEVSAIVAAMQIVIPSDSVFTGEILLQLVLTGAENDAVPLTAQSTPLVELPLPEIVITPPQNSTVTVGGQLLIVANASGAMSEVIPGDVACSGRRCSAPQPYFADGCEVMLRQPLPSACVSVDADGDRRPELPALYSRIVWLVVDDDRAVLVSREQLFYVAPVLGFNTVSKVIPAVGDNPAAINVELSLSPVPPGVVLGGGVTVQVSMNENPVGAAVTLSETMLNGFVNIPSPQPGSLTLALSETAQRNIRENYTRLTPDEPDNTGNYLYGVGNGVVEIVALQDGLIHFESAAPLPLVTAASFTISDLRVTSGTTTYALTQDEIEVSVLNNPDAASSASVTFSSNDLTVTFDSDVLRDGDVVAVALSLVSVEESPSTLVRSLLFPVALDGIMNDANQNNVPDSAQDVVTDVLPAYNEESAASSPLRVTGGGDLRLILGAYALNVVLRREDPPLYSAAFSPEDIRDEREEREDALPPPPSYNRAGIFDFSVGGLDNPGDTVTVFIPLLGEVRGGARLSKYAADDDGVFGWNPFTSNEELGMPGFFDRIWSAPKVAGGCPAIGASRGDGEEYAWRSAEDGLRSGDACLLLQIQDGGPNDADGLVNGVIYDPNAVTGGGGGGGGAMGWAWLLLLILGIFIGRGMKSRSAVHRLSVGK